MTSLAIQKDNIMEENIFFVLKKYTDIFKTICVCITMFSVQKSKCNKRKRKRRHLDENRIKILEQSVHLVHLHPKNETNF